MSFAATVYNASLSTPLNWIAHYIPKKNAIKEGLNFLAGTLPADGFKTFVVKPLALAGYVLKTINQESSYPTLKRLGADASVMKTFISGTEVITKLPAMLEVLSTRVDGESTYITRTYKTVNNEILDGEFELTPIKTIASKIPAVGLWFIGLADAINLVNNYRPVPNVLKKAAPYFYPVAGGFMAVASLYKDRSVIQQTWKKGEKEAATAEKLYACLNIAASITYLFSSVVGALGLYLKGKETSWLGKCQFAANVGIVLAPIAQKCAEYWMKVNVWTKKMDDNKDPSLT